VVSEDYKPLVPIVEEIRCELRAAARADSAARALGGGVARPRKRLQPSPAPSLALPARRIARRVAPIAALLALLGGVALAAHFGLGSGDGLPVNSTPTPIAKGRGWVLTGFRREGQLCVALTVGVNVSSNCAPSPDPLRAASALLAGRRLVAGFGGPGVRSVEVHVGPLERSGDTRAPLDRGAAEGAGVPTGSGWFAVSFPAGSAPAKSRAPARVLALGRRDRRLGPATLDCSLGALYRACARAASSQAQAELQH